MEEQSSKRHQNNKIAEAATLACFVLLLYVLAYTQSVHRMFWGDEIMGMTVLRQPSVSKLLFLWRHAIDSSGIFFYVFARPWQATFGTSELALRLFSATGVIASMLLLWRLARRFYSALPVLVSLAIVYLGHFTLRWQLSNGRAYGILLASVALALNLIFDSETLLRPGIAFSAAYAFSFAVVTGSHILGIAYAGALFALQIALDLRGRRFRPVLYACALVPMVTVFLFSLPNIRATSAAGKPSFWTIKPSYTDLFKNVIALNKHVVVPLGIVFLVSLLLLKYKRERVAVYYILLMFTGVDLVFFAISRVSTSIYVDRYLMPLALGSVLLCSELLTQLREADAPHPYFRRFAPLFLLPILWKAPRRVLDAWLPRPDYTQALLKSLPVGLPVVDTDIESFIQLEFYHHSDAGHDIVFPIDWQVALDPENQGGVSGYHSIDYFKETGTDAADIMPTADVLSKYQDFLVLTNALTPPVWLERRIKPTSARIEFLGVVPGNLQLWRVQK